MEFEMQFLRQAVWVHATTAGVLFGAFTLLTAAFAPGRLTGDEWATAVAASLVFGVAFGLVQAPVHRRAQRRMFDATLSVEERVAVVAAVQRAEPPADPRLRVAADNVARSWTRSANSPGGTLVLFALLLTAGVAGALLLDSGMWAVVALGALVAPWITAQVYRNRRDARRYLARPTVT